MERLKGFKDNPKFRTLILFLAIYGFLLSINTMGTGFKALGGDFAERLSNAIDDPISSFCIGLLITGLIQSSSGTTAILVALVAEGIIPMESAIPAIMGANIGTAITNTIVAFGHIGRKEEFKRAFGGSLVHDYFNVIAVIILLPLELLFHPMERMATTLGKGFQGIGISKVGSPVKFITKPVIHDIEALIAPLGHEGLYLIIIGILLLFFCLKLIVETMRIFMIDFAQKMVDQYLFKGPLHSFVLGLGLTSVIQSSSITTSLLVPLQGTGILKLEKVLPFTIGANIGTTVTAIMASMATGHPAAITLAFAHLSFNLLGGIIIAGLRPLRTLPARMARWSGNFVVDNKYGMVTMIGGYVIGTSYIFPLTYLLISGAAIGGIDTGDEILLQTGSSTVLPLAEEWAKVYNEPDITVSGGGSSHGFAALLKGEADLGDASRLLKSQDYDSLFDCDGTEVEPDGTTTEPCNEVIPHKWVVAFDVLTVVVHNENTWAMRLNYTQLHSIFTDDTPAVHWDEVPGLEASAPHEKIVIHAPDNASGTYDFFYSQIVGDWGEAGQTADSRLDAGDGAYIPHVDDNDILANLTGSKYAIGFFGFAYYHQNESLVKTVDLADGDDNFKAATLDNVADYPLSRGLFIYTDDNSDKRETVAEYLQFVYSEEGQKAIDEIGYVRVAAVDEDLFLEMKEEAESY